MCPEPLRAGLVTAGVLIDHGEIAAARVVLDVLTTLTDGKPRKG